MYRFSTRIIIVFNILLLLFSADATKCKRKICILTNSRSSHFHLTSLLKVSLQQKCSPCIQYASRLTLCKEENHGVIFFSPPHFPSHYQLNRYIEAKEKVIGIITYTDLRNSIPSGKRFQYGRSINYELKDRRITKKLIPVIASSYCRALSKPRPIRPSLSPSMIPSYSPTPSATPFFFSFDPQRNPEFNLNILVSLIELLLEQQLGVDIQVTGSLFDLTPPSPTPSISYIPSMSPTPSMTPIPSKRHRHPKPTPKYLWRLKGNSQYLDIVPDLHQVVRVCRRSNCAAQVTIVSQRYLRFVTVNNILNNLRTRADFSSVFTPDRSTYTIRRTSNTRFIVLIPFLDSFVSEF